MAKINVKTDCGNAPKMEYLRDFEVAFTNKDSKTILDCLDDNVYWNMVGDNQIQGKEDAEAALSEMLDGSITELTIENIITHGDVGAVNGTMIFKDGTSFAFCDVITFTSHAKDAKIKQLDSYVLPLNDE